MTRRWRPLHAPTAACALALAFALVLAGAVHAQSTNAQQQARTNQVRDQLRSSSLREQQRQQTSATTRKAFSSSQAREGIDQANRAQNDRYRAQQRNRVEDYLHREQAASTATSGQTQPAHASSTH